MNGPNKPYQAGGIFNGSILGAIRSPYLLVRKKQVVHVSYSLRTLQLLKKKYWWKFYSIYPKQQFRYPRAVKNISEWNYENNSRYLLGRILENFWYSDVFLFRYIPIIKSIVLLQLVTLGLVLHVLLRGQ